MRKQAVRWIDVAAFLACALTAIGWLAEARGWFDPAPFKRVRDVTVTRGDDGYTVQATYQKTDAPCDLVLPILVFGWVFGDREPLAYTPIRQENQGAQRFEGQQLMTLQVNANGRVLDRIEVWTRHDCEGRRVDTQMIDVALN